MISPQSSSNAAQATSLSIPSFSSSLSLTSFGGSSSSLSTSLTSPGISHPLSLPFLFLLILHLRLPLHLSLLAAFLLPATTFLTNPTRGRFVPPGPSASAMSAKAHDSNLSSLMVPLLDQEELTKRAREQEEEEAKLQHQLSTHRSNSRTHLPGYPNQEESLNGDAGGGGPFKSCAAACHSVSETFAEVCYGCCGFGKPGIIMPMKVEPKTYA